MNQIRDLVLQDPVALDIWGLLVDDLVSSPAQKRRIKDMMRRHEYGDAILGSLEIYESEKGGVSGLVPLLEKRNLNKLGARIQAHFGNSNVAESNARMVLDKKWWPDHKELITSFVVRTTSDGNPLADHLRQQLLSNDSKASDISSWKHALIGMGGIGKTSTAKWYANKYQDEYDHIMWVDSDGANLETSLDNLGSKLGISRKPKVSLQEFARKIYESFHGIRCLFIFDNAERFEGEGGLKGILPRTELHHSIITSRNHDWGNPNEFGQIRTFRMGIFTPTECVTLITKTLQPIGKARTEEEMLALGAELGFHPLALQCAVATIIKSRTYTLVSYTKRIQGDIRTLLDKKVLNEYERSISATLQLSIEQIENDEDIDDKCREWCKTILIIAAYCEPTKIPEALFLGLPIADRNVLIDAVDILLQYSLISEDKDVVGWITISEGFSIHRLLQRVVQHKALVDPECAVIAIKLALGYMADNASRFQQHAARAWTLASAQFDEILLTCYEVPLQLSRCMDSTKLLRDAIGSLKRVLKGTDLPIVQLQLRLVDWLVHDTETESWAEAERIIDEMSEALGPGVSGKIPHIDQLNLHLRIVALDVQNILVQKKSSINDLDMDGNRRILELNETLLNEMDETGYSGEIAGTRLCYPPGFHYNEFPLWMYMDLCYALTLHRAGKSQEAENRVSSLLDKGRDEIGITHLYKLFRQFHHMPKSTDSMIRIIFQHLRVSAEVKRTVEAQKCHAEAKRIAETYLEWLCDVKPSSLVDDLEMLEFMCDFDLGNEFAKDRPWLDFLLPHITRIISMGLQNVQGGRVEEAMNRAWKKVAIIAIEEEEGEEDAELLSRGLLFFNSIYTTALLECGTEKLPRILQMDTFILTYLIQSDIDWEEFHSFEATDWPPIGFTFYTPAYNENPHPNEVLQSKLGILLYIIRQTTSSIASTSNREVDDSVMDTYDSACSTLVLLERIDEAKSLWGESVEYLIRQKQRPSLSTIAKIGKHTLQLLEYKQQQDMLRLFMRIVEKCFEVTLGDPVVIIDENGTRQVSSETREDISKLIIRLFNIERVATAMELISRLKKRDSKGVLTPLVEVHVDPPMAEDVTRVKLAEILNSIQPANPQIM